MRAPEGHSVGDLQDFVLEGFQRQLSAPRQKKSAHFLHLKQYVQKSAMLTLDRTSTFEARSDGDQQANRLLASLGASA